MIEHPPDGTDKPEETTEPKNQTKAVVFTTENPAIGMGIPVEFTWQPNLQPIPRLETPSFSSQEETFEQKALRQEFKIYREDHKGFDGQRIEMFKLYNGMVLAISSAIFLGTLSVAKELTEVRGDGVVKWAWVFTVLAVLMAFLELLLSQFAYEKSQENLMTQYQSHDYEKALTNWYAAVCRYLLVAMCITLSLGVVLCTAFLFMNRHTPRRGDEPKRPANHSEIVPVHTFRTTGRHPQSGPGLGSFTGFRSPLYGPSQSSFDRSPDSAYRNAGLGGIPGRAQSDQVTCV